MFKYGRVAPAVEQPGAGHVNIERADPPASASFIVSSKSLSKYEDGPSSSETASSVAKHRWWEHRLLAELARSCPTESSQEQVLLTLL